MKKSIICFITGVILLVGGFIIQSLQFAYVETEVELEQMATSFGTFEFMLFLAIIFFIVGIIYWRKRE